MLDTSLIVMVVILALVFDFINGFHDTANAIATCVSTRAIRPGVAIVGTAILNFLGAMISTGVAKTIGGDIVISPTLVNEMIIIAGLVGAIIWNLLTWWVGMPSSSSHALIGGMIGAIIVSAGVAALNGWGILKIVLSLIISPVSAIITGFIIMKIIFAVCHSFKPAKVNLAANRLQVVSAALMAFSHGSNDAQKSMGIITLALVSGGFINSLEVPGQIPLCPVHGLGDQRRRLENHPYRRRQNIQDAPRPWLRSRPQLGCRHLLGYAAAPARLDDTRRFRLHHGCRLGAARQSRPLERRPANGHGLGHDHSLHGRHGCLVVCHIDTSILLTKESGGTPFGRPLRKKRVPWDTFFYFTNC